MSDRDSGVILRPATNADAPAVRELVFAVLREFGLTPDPAQTDADLTDLVTPKTSQPPQAGTADHL